jgi:hypothetical protein
MTYQEVYQEIVKALNNKQPFALIRIGDGEAMVIKKRKWDYVFKRQFGYLPEAKDMDKISELVKNAYINANIIGIPTKYHIEKCGSYWAHTYDWLKEARPQVADIPTCSIDVHSELLESGLLNELLQDREDLIYISGRNLDEGFKRKFNIKNVQSFIVNAEQLFETRKSSNHWPFQFDMIHDWISKLDCKGKLCLVGAGVLGKYYSSLLKKQGGIVCEIGHIFDSFAGKRTRGKGRSATAEDNTYKL